MSGFLSIKLLAALAATIVGYGVYRLSRVLYEEFTSPIRDLPGPTSQDLLYGNLKEIQEHVCIMSTTNLLLTLAQQEPSFYKWAREYGSVLQFKGLLNVSAVVPFLSSPMSLSNFDRQFSRLYITDTKALNHILMNSYVYQKTAVSRYTLSRVVGPGAWTLHAVCIHATKFIKISRCSCRRRRRT